jgi:DtxR family Mn-dependent transcriptional regulator
MYLLSILRLGEESEPVPLSQLATTLQVSSVSVNQMCRRLEEEGLVSYAPYKGVTITPVGAEVARRILRRHRLWEVFLVDRLQVDSAQAHDMACRLEHATSDQLTERLSSFLGHPKTNPEGEPIPESSRQILPRPVQSLTELEAGSAGYCIRCMSDDASCTFLRGQGLRPGAPFAVLAVAPDSMLLDLDGTRVALTRLLARSVLVSTEMATSQLTVQGDAEPGSRAPVPDEAVGARATPESTPTKTT